MPIVVRIDVELAKQKMSVGELPTAWDSPRRTWGC